MAGLKFHKLDGAGNDFVLIDAREGTENEPFTPVWIERLLDRHRGVGANGLLVVNSSPQPDLRVEVSYWNSDGYPAEFCGNGARCVAAFLTATEPTGPLSEDKQRMRYRLGEVTVDAVAAGTGRFSIRHPLPTTPDRSAELDDLPERVRGFLYNAGVPHWVLPVVNLADFDLKIWGPYLRRHPAFAPNGVNVDAVEIRNDTVYVRTYERGVEDETLACGSGLLASAWWAHTERNLQWPIRLQSEGGDRFLANEDDDSLWLEGPANRVFQGVLTDGGE